MSSRWAWDLLGGGVTEPWSLGGVFTGRGRLMDRPQRPYFDLFDEKGVRYDQKNGILTVEGRLTPGTYRLDEEAVLPLHAPDAEQGQGLQGHVHVAPALQGGGEQDL